MALQHAALRDTVCLEARGADAGAFLHAQLSRAVAELEPDLAPLAAWADARGRVRAILRVCRLADRWLLVTPRDGADELLKKLRLFVLRSRVTLARADDVGVAALLGNGDEWLAAREVRAADTPPNRLVRRDALLVDPRRRCLLAGPWYLDRAAVVHGGSRGDERDRRRRSRRSGSAFQRSPPLLARAFRRRKC